MLATGWQAYTGWQFQAQLHPFGYALALAAIGQPVIEAGSQLHFEAPWLATFPAGALQVMGSGSQGIGGAVPDIPAAIAVEVHRMGVVGGGDELGLAHGARPRAFHGVGLDIAILQDLQGGDQLCLGEGRATAFIGQGSQGADH
ncbi:hypothetical protein D3C84_750180 [compost metagenome]